MNSAEDEIRELKEKNNALAQKVQYWKMTAAQKEEEKIDLMKELNQLRLAMSHYRSSSSALDSYLDTSIQDFGEQTLTRLVEVSSAITRTVEVMKTYIRQKQELERSSPNGKLSLRDSPRDRTSNKVLRVVPMIRGRSIGKPIILLRPIDATAHGIRQDESEASQNQEETTSPPQHALPDVYIPLRRIDADTMDLVNVGRRSRSIHLQDEDDNMANMSLEAAELRLDEEVAEVLEENAEAEGRDSIEESAEEEFINRHLEAVLEETEDENWNPQVVLSRALPHTRNNIDNPLEGPSWMLDQMTRDTSSPVLSKRVGSRGRVKGVTSEPDSTTDVTLAECTPADNTRAGPSLSAPPAPIATSSPALHQLSAESPTATYTPTRRVRRQRARLSSPHLLHLLDEWARPANTPRHRDTETGSKDPTKVLVMVAKMRLDEARSAAPRTPPAPPPPLDAPSPNGSTLDAGPIIMDSAEQMQSIAERNEYAGVSLERQQNGTRDTSGHTIEEDITHTTRGTSSKEDTTSKLNDKTNDDNKRKRKTQKRAKKLTREESQERTIERLTGSNRESARRTEESPGEEMSYRANSSEESESDAGRPKRPRKAPPNYKEKPLNRKLRR